MGGAVSSLTKSILGGGSKQADNSAEMAALQAEKEQALAEKRAKQEELTEQEKAKARKARGLATLMGTSSTTGTINERLG